MLLKPLATLCLIIISATAEPANASEGSGTCRITEHSIAITGGSELERSLGCEGARQALHTLKGCAIAPKTTIRIQFHEEVRNPLAGAIFGYYDFRGQYIALTTLSRTTALMRETPYEGIPATAFLQSLAVHEIVHSVMHQNLPMHVHNPAVYEYLAYALQIASLPAEWRARFVNAFKGAEIKKLSPFSDTVLAFAPYVFAARAYDHFISSPDICVPLRQIMSGDLDVAVSMSSLDDTSLR